MIARSMFGLDLAFRSLKTDCPSARPPGGEVRNSRRMEEWETNITEMAESTVEWPFKWVTRKVIKIV